jgi:hypothetical protein
MRVELQHGMSHLVHAPAPQRVDKRLHVRLGGEVQSRAHVRGNRRHVVEAGTCTQSRMRTAVNSAARRRIGYAAFKHSKNTAHVRTTAHRSMTRCNV